MKKKQMVERWKLDKIFKFVSDVSKGWQIDTGATFGERCAYEDQLTKSVVNYLKSAYESKSSNVRFNSTPMGKVICYFEKEEPHRWYREGKMTYGEFEAMKCGRHNVETHLSGIKVLMKTMDGVSENEFKRRTKGFKKKDSVK